MATTIKKAAQILAEMKIMAKGDTTTLAIIAEKEQQFMALLQNSNPIDWNAIETEFSQEVRLWVLESKVASNKAHTNIATKNESGESPMIIDAILSVIGNIDMRFTIAIEMLKMAVEVLKSKPIDTLTEFHTSWTDSLDAASKKKVDFKAFQEYIYCEFYGIDPQGMIDPNKMKSVSQGDVLKAIKPYIERRVLPSKDMEKFYLNAWLASTKDKDTGWFANKDNDAGYIVINMRYICPVVTMFNMGDLTETGTWVLTKSYIDDVQKPSGTNNAILGTYGNDPLMRLPYKVVVNVSSEGANGNRGYNLLNKNQQFTKSPQGLWDYKKGDVRILKNWIRNQGDKLKVKDLGIE